MLSTQVWNAIYAVLTLKVEVERIKAAMILYLNSMIINVNLQKNGLLLTEVLIRYWAQGTLPYLGIICHIPDRYCNSLFGAEVFISLM